MNPWRVVLVAVTFFCVIGYTECSQKKFLNKEDTMNAILKGREHFRRTQVEPADSGEFSAQAIDGQTIYDILEKAYNMFKMMNDTEKEKTKEGIRMLALLLETGKEALENNGFSDRCDQCLVAVKFLKAVTVYYSWEEVGNVAYNICMNYGAKVYPGLDDLPDNAEQLCHIVWIQGPHVYAVAEELGITTLVQCQFLNRCTPQPSTDTSVDVGGATLPPIFGNFRDLLPAKNPVGKRSLRGQRKSPQTNARSRRRRDLSNAIKVAYLTDIHMDLHYQENTNTECGLPVCCTMGQGAGKSGPWGDYNCNLPYQTYNLFLEKLKALGPDFTLYGGDNPPHKVWTDTEWGQFNCTWAMIDGLQTVMPNVPAYPNIGNHETFPTNLYYTELNATKELNDLFGKWWQPLSGFDQDNLDTLNEYFYFAKEVKTGLVLLSFNSLYMYTDNWYISVENTKLFDNRITKMKKFMIQTMEDAMTNGQKVILMGHVPPGNGAVIPGRWLTNFVMKYGDLIVLYVAGHTHDDDFRLIADQDTMEAKAVCLVAPSMDTRTHHNPGMRMFYLDPVTFEALDYEQYYLNLTKAVGTGDPDIELEYRATEEYGMKDLSADSYADLAKRMTEDTELFNTVVANFYTQIYANGESCTSDGCHNSWMCRVTNSNNDQRGVCSSEGYFLTPMTTTPPPACVETGSGAISRCSHLVVALMLTFLTGARRLL